MSSNEASDGIAEGNDNEMPANTYADTAYDVPVLTSNGQTVLHPEIGFYEGLINNLLADGYQMCVDLCGVDYCKNLTRKLPNGTKAERFELVVNFLDLSEKRRIRVRVQLPEDDPKVPSISMIYPGAEAMEREASDMFGFVFEGHPDPTPILLPEGWMGHPLRKDFSMGRIPVQFKAVEGR
ncbi:MAG: NADH-quinone oxidoreductase subunit C [Actinomycetota bacterium]|nr:NADH-quinone oxidoreductase subunit C [Actinomycetota bacterium]